MFLSGSMEIFEAVKTLNFKVYDILAKPINPRQLIKTLNKAVDRPQIPVKPSLQSNPIKKIQKQGQSSRFFDGGFPVFYTF
jgi:DNA-binding NtrC family response regulator